MLNLLFEKTLHYIEKIQKFEQSKSGLEKKDMCIRLVNNWVDNYIFPNNPDLASTYKYFVTNYLDDMVDVLVFVAKSKALSKAFKKKCGCIAFMKKGKKADKIVDDMIYED